MKISESLLRAICSVWIEIEADAYDMCDGDNQLAIEFVLDAGRLSTFGFAKEHEELSQILNMYGYEKVVIGIDNLVDLL